MKQLARLMLTGALAVFIAMLVVGCQRQPKARPLTGADVSKDVAKFGKKIETYAADIEKLRPTADKARLGELEANVNALREKVKVMGTQTPDEAVKTKGEILDLVKVIEKTRRVLKKQGR